MQNVEHITQQPTAERPAERPTNEAIAAALEALAAALEERDANPHRVQAYLTAAETVRHAERSMTALLDEGGPEALKALPGIGDSLAARIAGYVETGRLQLLHRLRSDAPERVLARVPGIGPGLARTIHEALGITTLEELEMATHDGRLESVKGFGPRRVRALQAQLAALLGRAARRTLRQARRAAIGGDGRPAVEMLLQVDRTYLDAAAHGTLPRVAPKRFNPDGEAWLPVLHARRGPWSFTAVFSNTARAHELGRTTDWVVLYHERDGREGQATVVTETRGDLAGLRVVRGREAECRAYYARARRRAA